MQTTRKVVHALAVTLLLLLLISCENDNPSTLVGTWITESCEEGTSFDLPNDYWVQGVFRFSSKGKIEVGKNLYVDSRCQDQDTEIPPGIEESSTEISYEDLGEDPRSKDKGARGLLIVLKSDAFSLEVEGLYAIDDGRICFSEGFDFHSSGIRIDQLGDATRIDYENGCLLYYTG